MTTIHSSNFFAQTICIRYFLISAHYRSQLNYSKDNLEAAKASLSRLYTSLRGMDTSVEPVSESDYRQRFIRAMDDDFNAPEALSVLFDMVKVINTNPAPSAIGARKARHEMMCNNKAGLRQNNNKCLVSATHKWGEIEEDDAHFEMDFSRH